MVEETTATNSPGQNKSPCRMQNLRCLLKISFCCASSLALTLKGSKKLRLGEVVFDKSNIGISITVFFNPKSRRALITRQ